MPAWARVAPEQIAEAKKHGVPVAFENDLGMRFVLIPAGTFWMGSPEDEEGREYDETQHEVTITKPFYMSMFEVTNSQYLSWKPDHVSGSFTLGDGRHPVVRVDWIDSTGFAHWLSRQRGRTYRLPSESEWEYACRAGSVTAYATGRDITSSQARFSSNLGTAPVGAFPPDAWGLHDMHGNAQEWCRDAWHLYGYAAKEGSRAAMRGTDRVGRGGGWALSKERPRSAARNESLDQDTWLENGRRLVADLPEPGEGER